MNDTLKGAAQSKTVWVAGALAVLSNLAPLVPVVCLAAHLDPVTIQVVGSVFSAVMVALRSVTTSSLADKVAPPVLPPPVGDVK